MPLIETVTDISEQDKQLFKEVKKVKGSDIMKGFKFPTGIDHAVIDEHKNILNYCTENYSLVENKKIFLPIEEKLRAGKVDYIRQVKIVTESQFYVTYLLKSKNTKKLGELYPRLTIINSYDGKVKFRHEFGWFRLVCTNGLTRPHGETNISVNKQSSDLTEASLMFLIRDILKDTETFLEETKKDLAKYEAINSKKVTAKLIAEVTKQLKLSDKLADAATARFKLETGTSDEAFTYVDLEGNLRSGRTADPTLFTLYNAINFAIYNENPKEPIENKQKKDSALLELVEARLN